MGLTTRKMMLSYEAEKVLSCGTMAHITLECSRMVLSKVKVPTFGPMAANTLANGPTTKCQARVHSNGLTTAILRATSRRESCMATGSTRGRTVASMRATISTTRNMVRGLTPTATGASTKASGATVCNKAKAPSFKQARQEMEFGRLASFKDGCELLCLIFYTLQEQTYFLLSHFLVLNQNSTLRKYL